MTDVTSNKPLRVSGKAGAWPYINLPFSQLEEVRRLLDGHGVRYSVTENAISLNDGPFFIVIDLGRDGNPEAVQRVLDSVP